MAVVLEGPDRAGKTTLAEIIAEQTGATIRHLGGSENVAGIVVRHWEKVMAAVAQDPYNTVYDRMTIGSIVYSFKADAHNVNPVSTREYTTWLTWMARQSNLLICALPPLDVVLERMKVGEEYISRDEMVTVWRRYNSMFSGFRFQHGGYTAFRVLFYDSSVYAAQEYYDANASIIRTALGAPDELRVR